jgi:hypothetical protein
MTKLEGIAMLIALSVPKKQSKYATKAYISWDLIRDLQKELSKKHDLELYREVFGSKRKQPEATR